MQYAYYAVASSLPDGPGTAVDGGLAAGTTPDGNANTRVAPFNAQGGQNGTIEDFNGNGVADLGPTTTTGCTDYGKPRAFPAVWSDADLSTENLLPDGCEFEVEKLYHHVDALTGEETDFDPVSALLSAPYAPANWAFDAPSYTAGAPIGAQYTQTTAALPGTGVQLLVSSSGQQGAVPDCMESDSDANLLDLFNREGSEAAFAGLVRRHIDLVYSTSLRRVRDPHLAEDVTQAVFLVLARKSRRLNPDVRLAGWLFKTARNLSADALKLKKRRAHHERAAAMTEEAIAPSAEIDIEILHRLEQAMDALASTDRDAIPLRYYRSMGVNEVAAALGLTENTAAKRLSRALEHLRQHLTSQGLQAPATAVSAVLANHVTVHAPAGLTASCTNAIPSVAAHRLVQRAFIRPILTASAVGVVITGIVITTIAVNGWIDFRPARNRCAPPPLAPAIVALNLPDDLEPSTDEQARQIRGAVWTLRHASAFARMTDWMSAVRSLVQIGKPAVPESTDDSLSLEADTARRCPPRCGGLKVA